MSVLENKIDFAVILSVTNANPNGDPLNGNRPRETYDGLGEISDVCIKRKIRNRLQDMGQCVFVQSDDRSEDGCKSLKDRANAHKPFAAAVKKKDSDKAREEACSKWIDVRSFGQVFAFAKRTRSKNKEESNDSGEIESSGVSIPVRGPVSIHPAFSVSPINITSLQITKSVNSETNPKNTSTKSSDTMGMKHRVDFGLYVAYGSINCQLAEKTGFSEEDAELIKEALRTLFKNDASSARPDGSMEICKLYWWKHNCKSGQYSSAKVHRSLQIAPKTDTPKSFSDYEITLTELKDLQPEILDGV